MMNAIINIYIYIYYIYSTYYKNYLLRYISLIIHFYIRFRTKKIEEKESVHRRFMPEQSEIPKIRSNFDHGLRKVGIDRSRVQCEDRKSSIRDECKFYIPGICFCEIITKHEQNFFFNYKKFASNNFSARSPEFFR